ncbi:MAG TPA: helix-turn-helix domain-containing protein [Actinospica sp.]|nr:helix-turn-helix domain-containing protein [Actinospica sp.]
MGDPAGRAVLTGIVERMCGEPAALDAVVRAARAKSPSVAALPECEVRRNVAALLAAVAQGFAGGAPVPDPAAADALAADRVAQGVPLDGLLEGFQAGRAHLLLVLTEQARARGVAPETLIDALVELDGFTTELQNRLIHTYRTHELGQARTGYAIRLQALRALLHGAEGVHAAEAGLDPAKRYHCLIADVTEPREAARVEAVLAAAGGIAGFVDGYLCCVTPRLPAPDSVDHMAVVTSPAQPATRLATVYPLCRSALAAARRRALTGLRSITELSAFVAVDAHPELGRVLAADLLPRLDPAKSFHRLLAQTALAYLAHGRQLTPTAAALHVHANTVKHRLRRMTDLTGFGATPAEPITATLHWWWALDVWLREVGEG